MLTASPTSWTWVWASSRSWWWTGKPGMLQSLGSQSWTWLSNWTELNLNRRDNIHKEIKTTEVPRPAFNYCYFLKKKILSALKKQQPLQFIHCEIHVISKPPLWQLCCSSSQLSKNAKEWLGDILKNEVIYVYTALHRTLPKFRWLQKALDD